MRNSDCSAYLECLAEAAKLGIKMDCNRCAKEGRLIMTGPEIKRDEQGNVIVPEGYIFQPGFTNSKGIAIPDHFRKHGYKPSKTTRDYKTEYKRRKEHPESKRPYHRVKKDRKPPIIRPNRVSAAPLISAATPTEIIIALRKGMAQEIVDMIKEKFEL